MALMHTAVCDECGKREPAVQPIGGLPGTTSALLSGYYDYPAHWLRVDGKAFCGYGCLYRYAKARAQAPQEQ